MGTRYIEWLQSRGVSLLYGAGIYWRPYKKALLPATISPCFLDMDEREAGSLLRESKCLFVRYESPAPPEPTEWWYIVCDSYDTAQLSSKARNQIKRGKRSYGVDRVDSRWFADNGYDCYLSAFARYSHARPVTRENFHADIMARADGPFEHWGVFDRDKLVGYGQFIVDGDDVLLDVAKFDPDHLRNYCAYALYDTVLDHYVGKCNMRLNDGNRPVSHETNMHENLLKFGFKKAYAVLNVVYRPWFQTLISVAYPMDKLIRKLPDNSIRQKVLSLLFQEEIRRGCLNVASKARQG